MVARPPAALMLTFNEPVSPLALRLVGPDGDTRTQRRRGGGRHIVVGAARGLPRGTHLLSWRVISVDGHPVGGALMFSVGAPSVTPEAAPAARSPADAERPLRVAIWLARLVLYVGLFCGVGGAFYAAWIAGGPLTPRTRRSVAVALECGLVACIVLVGLQGIDVLGLTLPDLGQPRVWMAGLATSYGWTAIIALMSLAAGRIALDAQINGSPRWRLPASASRWPGAGTPPRQPPQVLTRAAVLLHAMTVAFWIGALLPLASAMRTAERRTAELLRFSRSIPLAVVALAASGGALAVIQLRQFDALWTTDYGLVLCAKLVAVAVLIALAGGQSILR